MALFGVLISVGNLFEVWFTITQKLYDFFAVVFWIIFWLLIILLFFGVLGIKLADENGIKQISLYLTSTAEAQLF